MERWNGVSPNLATFRYSTAARSHACSPDVSNLCRGAPILVRRSRGRIVLPGGNGAVQCGTGGNGTDGLSAESFCGRGGDVPVRTGGIFRVERVLAIRDVFGSVRVFWRFL